MNNPTYDVKAQYYSQKYNERFNETFYNGTEFYSKMKCYRTEEANCNDGTGYSLGWDFTHLSQSL